MTRRKSVHQGILDSVRDSRRRTLSYEPPPVVAALSSQDLNTYLAMSKEELIEMLATYEDHHNEHHEREEELLTTIRELKGEK